MNVVVGTDLYYVYPEQRRQAKTMRRNSREPRKAPLEALSGLSFTAREGKITAFLGPNGSGKSTTFKMMTAQLRPQRGSLQVLGLDVIQEAQKLRGLLGVCFQSPSLDPLLSIRENLEIQASLYAKQLKKTAAQRLDEVLGLLGLSDRATVQVQALSGGLARRVELAKALLHEPRVIMLDEPTAGVDPLVRREFWRELERLKDEGVSILISTHLMDEAEMCDELIFLSEGKLMGAGTPLQLKSDYGAEILVIETQDSEAFVEKLKVQLKASESWQKFGSKIRIETHQPGPLLDWIRKQLGEDLRHLEWSKPSLADVYFSKTGKILS